MRENSIDLKSIQKQLVSDRIKIRDQISRQSESNANSATNPDRSDLAMSYDQRQRNTAWLEQLEQRLSEIEDALERLNDGSYGKCESCGNEISSARLGAKPYATLCIHCQEKFERR
jgi:RNA polymerase-binding protein DksA